MTNKPQTEKTAKRSKVGTGNGKAMPTAKLERSRLPIKASDTVILGRDETYRVELVYAYGPVSLYRELGDKLFGPGVVPTDSAKGFFTFGPLNGTHDVMVGLVWVNNSYKLEETLPVCIHEIVHVSQDILRYAQVEDRCGEAQAYIVERECARVLEQLYRMPVMKANTPKIAKLLGVPVTTKKSHR